MKKGTLEEYCAENPDSPYCQKDKSKKTSEMDPQLAIYCADFPDTPKC